MYSINDRRSLFGVNFLEDLELHILTKEEAKSLSGHENRGPPKVKGKHFSNLEYLAESDLIWLTPNPSESFPCSLYNKTLDLSYIEQCFRPVKKLGEGSFGTVLQVISKRDSYVYAMKVSKEPFKSDNDRDLKLREVSSHKTFSEHPNVVTLYEAWEEDRYMYMQMELCKMSLDHVKAMTEYQCWQVLADIASALNHMHEFGFGHFDVKLENIQLGYDGLYKLGDFGLVFDTNEKTRQPVEGDAKYMAPELLSSRAQFTVQADIFSLGISVLELAGNLSLPSNGDVWKALRENVFPFTQTSHISNDLFSILTKMMSQQPKNRPTAKDILDIPRVKEAVSQNKWRYVPSDQWELEHLPPCQLRGRQAILQQRENISSSHPEENEMSVASTSPTEPVPFVTSTPFIAGMQFRPLPGRDTLGQMFPTPESTQEGQHSFIPPTPMLQGASQTSANTSNESPLVRIPLAPLVHSNSPNCYNSGVPMAVPTLACFGISPVRLSNELKADMKAKKRKRLMTPRNLTSTFNDEEFDV